MRMMMICFSLSVFQSLQTIKSLQTNWGNAFKYTCTCPSLRRNYSLKIGFIWHFFFKISSVCLWYSQHFLMNVLLEVGMVIWELMPHFAAGAEAEFTWAEQHPTSSRFISLELGELSSSGGFSLLFLACTSLGGVGLQAVHDNIQFLDRLLERNLNQVSDSLESAPKS